MSTAVPAHVRSAVWENACWRLGTTTLFSTWGPPLCMCTSRYLLMGEDQACACCNFGQMQVPQSSCCSRRSCEMWRSGNRVIWTCSGKLCTLIASNPSCIQDCNNWCPKTIWPYGLHLCRRRQGPGYRLYFYIPSDLYADL